MLNNFLHGIPLYIVTKTKSAPPVLGIEWLSVSSPTVWPGRSTLGHSFPLAGSPPPLLRISIKLQIQNKTNY